MFSTITKNLLAASRELAETRLEINRKNGKSPNMEKIHYRFPTRVKYSCEKMSNNLSTNDKEWTESDVARAAMYLGMKELEAVYNEDKVVARSLMHLLAIKAKLFK